MCTPWPLQEINAVAYGEADYPGPGHSDYLNFPPGPSMDTWVRQ